MKVILDTHILLWALGEDPRLSQEAKGIILNQDNDIYYSAVSIWEIAIKHLLRPEQIGFSPEQIVDLSEKAGFLQVTLKDHQTFMLSTLKRKEGAPVHKDPFDRILIAQAKAENMLLLTHDSLLKDYEEACVRMV